MIGFRQRLVRPAAVIWCVAIAAAIVIGCRGTSPLMSLNFANTLIGTGSGGGQPPTTQAGEGLIQSVCDLDPNRRGIRVAIFNLSPQFVRYAMTFIVSAGPGGFVCDAELPDYISAGYRDLALDTSNSHSIGCDTIRLLGGTRLLGLRVSDVIAQNLTGDPNTAPSAQRPLDGNTFIPLPEAIVLGDNDPIFTCTGNNLCSQRGFVYSDIANNPIAFINASRTQDTVCEANAGTAPEWRLGDPNEADNLVEPFQYPSGATILIGVLARADNVNPDANQVVWHVLDVEGNTIHQERP